MSMTVMTKEQRKKAQWRADLGAELLKYLIHNPAVRETLPSKAQFVFDDEALGWAKTRDEEDYKVVKVQVNKSYQFTTV